ncbi:hypothetical protein RFI_37325, partial [Reticulomyxa filosa]
KAPDLFNAWCQSMIELLLTSEAFPSLLLSGARNVRGDIDDMYSTFETVEARRNSIMTPRTTSLHLTSPDKEDASPSSSWSPVALDNVHAYDDFGDVMQYLNQREVEGPSLLAGITKSKLTKQCHIGQVVFGLKELHQIYPKLSIPLNNIMFSICVAQANKQIQNWYQSTINALDETLHRLFMTEAAYQRKISFTKSCLFAAKLHMFVVNEEIPFHLSINMKDSNMTDPTNPVNPATGTTDKATQELAAVSSSKPSTVVKNNPATNTQVPPRSKIWMEFFCDCIPDFIDKILYLYPKLCQTGSLGKEEKDEKQRSRVICLLINKFIEKVFFCYFLYLFFFLFCFVFVLFISIHLKAHYSSEGVDNNMLRGIHDVISTSLFYLLNSHLWKKDLALLET